uniref:Protein Wnt n=1 Tax=Cacopsylla melanoneura TaxID=428564 RepID=A0A8D9BXB3_9HEMI
MKPPRRSPARFLSCCICWLLTMFSCFTVRGTGASQAAARLSPGSWINIAHHVDNFSSWSLPPAVTPSLTLSNKDDAGEGAGAGASSSSTSRVHSTPLPRISLEDSAAVCARVPGLSFGQLRQCSLFADHMTSVGRGATDSILECQHQFRHDRWNCSSGGGGGGGSGGGGSPSAASVQLPALHVGSREAAFTHAIATAGVVYAVARSCKDGSLPSCGCSRTARPKDLKRDWLWGGCGDNLEYGYKFTQGFVDVRERERPLKKGSKDQGRALMNLHNNEAGRRAVIRASRVTCKCHGVSGSCSMITCWQQLTPFREIGEFLRDKYETATEVRVTKRGKLTVRSPRYSQRPTVNDLVYLEESPNYCVRDPALGSRGTQGRTCNRTSRGLDSCHVLCCGRGYNTLRVTRSYRCDCKFHWCCHVQCRQCTETREIHTCK